VTYTSADAREQLLDGIAEAIEELGIALASLSEAYEQSDEQSGDRLEEQIFRPTQIAYGRAQRTHAEFAERHGLATRTFEQALPGAPSRGVKGFLASAVAAIADADRTLAALQDSMMPVEVGDAQLRAGLEEVRELLGGLSARADQFVRTLGR
jgi:hypothetical protein